MTYIQAHNAFRTVRADLDRINRLIKSPRISEHTKVLLRQEQTKIAVQVEIARNVAVALQSKLVAARHPSMYHVQI